MYKEIEKIKCITWSFVLSLVFLSSAIAANKDIALKQSNEGGKNNGGALKSVVQESVLFASSTSESDVFGYAVSIDGNRALVGANGDDDSGNDAGAVYVFEFDGIGWNQTAKLTASDGAAGDAFGDAVSLQGDRALVGARWKDGVAIAAGAAYVFDFDGMNWTETAKLIANDGAASSRFGESVSLSGDRVLIGANGEASQGYNSGAAYVFEFDGMNWSQSAKLTAADGAANDNFAWTVSLDGNRALIGSRQDDDNGTDSGSAYVFDFDGMNWIQNTKLLPSDGAADDFFGLSVSLSGDRALVGAHRDDVNGSYSGSAYVFEYDGVFWAQSAKLLADDGAAFDQFGFAVSLSGDRALVGAYGDDDNGDSSGSAYVFDYDGMAWIQTNKLIADDGDVGDLFGRAVSVDAGRMIVGAPYDDRQTVSSAGSAYVFVDQYNLNVSVTGLAGGTLSVSNGADAVDFLADGSQSLSVLNQGSAFDVQITAQPQMPNQVCAFGSLNSGVINGADVLLNIICTTTQYNVQVDVTGLAGVEVSFSNGSDDLDVDVNGIHVISTLADGSAYDVIVTAQPTSPNQVCQIIGAADGVLNGADQTLNVTCDTVEYQVAGQVSGLLAGNELVLQNNGGDDLLLSANGSFAFTTPTEDGGFYDVVVMTQPDSPNQTCEVSQGSGQIDGGDVFDVAVDCTTDLQIIGGVVSGLSAGNSVTLSLNNGDQFQVVSGNVSFEFNEGLEDGSAYAVSVVNQPTTPNQTCVVNNGSGNLSGQNVSDVSVACQVNPYFVGGYVVDLFPDNFMIIQNNGSDELILTGEGPFVFSTPLNDEGGFDVTIFYHPDDPIQPCEVVNGAGSVAGDDVDHVLIDCGFGDDLIYRHGFDTAEGISPDTWAID